MDSPFVCSSCAAFRVAPGDCPCGAGPLLDIRDEASLAALREDDQRRSERAKQRNLLLGMFLGMATTGAIIAAIPNVILQIPEPILFANPLKVSAMTVGLSALAVALLNLMIQAKPRFEGLPPRR